VHVLQQVDVNTYAVRVLNLEYAGCVGFDSRVRVRTVSPMHAGQHHGAGAGSAAGEAAAAASCVGEGNFQQGFPAKARVLWMQR